MFQAYCRSAGILGWHNFDTLENARSAAPGKTVFEGSRSTAEGIAHHPDGRTAPAGAVTYGNADYSDWVF